MTTRSRSRPLLDPRREQVYHLGNASRAITFSCVAMSHGPATRSRCAARVAAAKEGLSRRDSAQGSWRLSVHRADEALLAAEAKPDLAVENRPALYLTRVPVSGQRAARIDQAVHDQVVAVGLERVADPVDRVMDEFSHRLAPLG